MSIPCYVAGDLVSKAPPDGYTLLEQSNSVWIGPLLQKAPYDPVAVLISRGYCSNAWRASISCASPTRAGRRHR